MPERDLSQKLNILNHTGLNPLRVSEWVYNAELRNILTFKRLLERGDEMLTISMGVKEPQIDMLVLDSEAYLYVLEIKKKITAPSQVYDILLQTLTYTAQILDWNYVRLDEEFQKYWNTQPFEPKNLNLGLRWVHKEFFKHNDVFKKTRFQKTPRILLVVEEMNTSRVTEAVNLFRGCDSFEQFEERCLPQVTKNSNHRKKISFLQENWDAMKSVQFYFSIFMPRVIAEAMTKPQHITTFERISSLRR